MPPSPVCQQEIVHWPCTLLTFDHRGGMTAGVVKEAAPDVSASETHSERKGHKEMFLFFFHDFLLATKSTFCL